MGEKDTLRRVRDGLDHLQAAIQPFVAVAMTRKYGPRWVMYASRAGDSSNAPLDLYGLLKTMLDQWRDVFDESFARNDKPRVRTFVSVCFEARNTISHLAVPLTDAEGLRYLDAMVALAAKLKAPAKEADALKALYDEQRRDGIAPTATSPAPVAVLPVAPPAGTLSLALEVPNQPAGALRPWTTVALPHPDVLANRFKQSEFAADLAAVDMGNASGDYGKPDDFFRITFLTEGLKRVLRTALERLSGKGGDPVLGLQTNFGGGKTHTMLALYHLARSDDLSRLEGVADLAKGMGISGWQEAKTAVFVGTAEGVDASLKTVAGPKLRTVWGYVAWRLAGDAGLAVVKEAEAAGTNPGSKLLVDVFGLAGPSVILLDEVVAFARQLPDDRFEAFLSFIQSLTEAAKMVPNVLVVGSLPESDIEAGGAKGVEALRRLQQVFGRVVSPWLAADGDETYEIVRRRLFQRLDVEGEKARDETVKAFHELYRKNAADFPPFAKEPRYGDLLRLSYPIHPELFERLSKDWSTLERFQRTRGVLRLMANVVSVLWHQRTVDPLILPGRVPLADERVKASVVYPLDAKFSAVIDSEVDGEGSLPARMEANPNSRISKARAATRVARAVFIGSAPTVGQPNAGVTGHTIRLAAAEPGDQLAIFGEALRDLHENATYLYEEAGRYWFSTQPTLNDLADGRAKALPPHEVDAHIVSVLQKETTQRGGFAKVHAAPDDPSTIDEAETLALVILRPGSTHTRGAAASPAMDAAADALTRCRSTQRKYRNTLVFAAPDEAALGTARAVVRKAIAWDTIRKDTVVRGQLTESQIKDVEDRARSTKEAAEKAIRAGWTHILYAHKEEGTLDGKPFEVAQTTLLARDRPSIVASVFEKLSPKGDSIVKETLGPKILMSKLDPLWPADRPHLPIAEIREWFAAYVYLPKLRDFAVLEEAIANGVSGTDPQFGYAERFDETTRRYDGLAYARQAPPRLAPNGLLVRKEVASAQVNEAPPKPNPIHPILPDQKGHTDLSSPSPPLPADTKPRRFFGSVELDMVRPVKAFDAILNAVVAELQRTPGAKVRLSLEIEAEAPAGFPDSEVSVVRDNAKQLKFKAESTGFE